MVRRFSMPPTKWKAKPTSQTNSIREKKRRSQPHPSSQFQRGLTKTAEHDTKKRRRRRRRRRKKEKPKSHPSSIEHHCLLQGKRGETRENDAFFELSGSFRWKQANKERLKRSFSGKLGNLNLHFVQFLGSQTEVVGQRRAYLVKKENIENFLFSQENESGEESRCQATTINWETLGSTIPKMFGYSDSSCPIRVLEISYSTRNPVQVV